MGFGFPSAAGDCSHETALRLQVRALTAGHDHGDDDDATMASLDHTRLVMRLTLEPDHPPSHVSL